MKLLILSTLLSLLALEATANEHLHPGGRHGLHGMVIFGAGPYFISHIPMNHAPHDMQIIAEVDFTDASGAPIQQSFSESTFTLKPALTFSLNDFVLGDISSFEGGIYNGSFELGAPIVPGFEQVKVTVKTFKLIRKIPKESEVAKFELEDGKNKFEINVITPSSSVQKIDNLTSEKTLWCVIGPDFFKACP